MIRSKQEAQSDLGRFAGLLFASVRNGLREFRQYGPLRYRHRKRTDSSIINDLIVDQARQNFADIPGVEFTDRYKCFLLGFFGRWVVKFKKLDENLRPAISDTQTFLDFVNQQAAPELPGAEGPTNLHLGYLRLNQVALEDSSVFLVCPQGRRLSWEWELLDDGSGLLVPSPLIPQVDLPRTRQVLPRRIQEPAAEAEDGDAAEERDAAGDASE
jgi:hypothetical protein